MGEREKITDGFGLQLERRNHGPPAGENLLETQGGEGRPLVGRHFESAGPIFLAVFLVPKTAAARRPDVCTAQPTKFQNMRRNNMLKKYKGHKHQRIFTESAGT